MSNNDGNNVPLNGVETKWEKFQREEMTGRQALKRLGLGSAMAAFAGFSVNDLANMVTESMGRQSAFNVVAVKVA